MSRCAHMQSDYRLHKLPRCSRCKIEFQLTMGRYEDDNGNYKLVEEWECTKCGKVVEKRKLLEEPLTEQDKQLHEWCINEQRREKYRKRKNT